MKKQLITSFCGLICAATLTGHSFAQTTAMHQQDISDAKNSFDYVLTPADNAAPVTPALGLNEVSSKAIRSFYKSFKDVKDAKWYAIDKNDYLALFTNTDGRDSRAAFAKDGYMYYAINYGDEKSLPKADRHVIKSNYVDYNIGKVAEVTADGQKVFVVNLQDPDNLVVARTEGGSLNELAHYQTHLPQKKHRKGKVIIPQ